MPLTPQLNDFLTCPICFNCFSQNRKPITLTCSHTCCSSCLKSLPCCPFDQTVIDSKLPENQAILGLVMSASSPATNGKDSRQNVLSGFDEFDDFNEGFSRFDNHHGVSEDDLQFYNKSINSIKQLAFLLKPQRQQNTPLSRPMQRKLITLLHCQIVDGEGRSRAMRNARSIGERALAEILIRHQDSHQLSSNLWAAVRARGCQFLGPAMQEEVLRLVLLALEDGSALSRKVLVMFVVQRLSPHFPHQASKTAIGHVIQLLYRASCFKLTKREGDSSLMQLKEEYCSYEALRREHDTQIVSIALEAGLRISPDQWSSLLYGDTVHKSHMQSIIDKLQSPASFSQSIQELVIALQRTGDPSNLMPIKQPLERLAMIEPGPINHECPSYPSHQQLSETLEAAKNVTFRLVEFLQKHGMSHNTSNPRTARVSTPSSNRPRVGRVKPVAQQSISPQHNQFSPITILASPTRTIQRPCASVQPSRILGSEMAHTLIAQPNNLSCNDAIQNSKANSLALPVAVPNAVPAILLGPNTPTQPVGTILSPQIPVQAPASAQAPPTLPSEEDQFIPFADQPFVSKYGPISRIMSLINTPTMASSGNGMTSGGAVQNGLNNRTHSTNVILGRTAVPSLTLIQPLQQLVLTTTTILTEPGATSYGNAFVSEQPNYVNPDHNSQDSSIV